MRCSGEVWRPLQRQLRSDGSLCDAGLAGCACRTAAALLSASMVSLPPHCTATVDRGSLVRATTLERDDGVCLFACVGAHAHHGRVGNARQPAWNVRCTAQRAPFQRTALHRQQPAYNSQRTTASVQQPAYNSQRTTYSSADHAHTHRDSRTTPAAHCALLQSCCTSRRRQRAQPRVMCALRLPVNGVVACARVLTACVCARVPASVRTCAHTVRACVHSVQRRARVRAPEGTAWQVCDRPLSDRLRSALRTIVRRAHSLAHLMSL
jgi:hypothetical protein